MVLLNAITRFKKCVSLFFLFTIIVNHHNIISLNKNDDVHLYKIFSSQNLKNRFANFLDIILRQTSSTEFFDLVDKLNLDKQKKSDIEIYEILFNNIDTIKHGISIINQFKALHYQKGILSDQLKHLLKEVGKVSNVVEIGTPGTYISSIKNFLHVKDNIYVLNDAKKWTDYAQSFSFNPTTNFLIYDKFIPLNGYAEIKQNDIPDNCVDVVICLIGLHHIPENLLDGFIASINRILKPGGIFILRDHDCKDADVESLIYAAHSIYNVLMTKETIESEKAEYRNFKPLTFWIKLLEKHGFGCGSERLVQKGDPTINTMIKFTKIARTSDERITEISNDLKAQDDYERPLIQSYLSSPEWVNVDVAKEYAAFIEHTPFYEFPYFKSINTYWKVFGDSFKAACNKQGKLETLKSSYMLMNLFIGITMTAEYFARGIVSWPVAKMYSGAEALKIKLLISDPKNEIDFDERIVTLKQYPNFNLKLIEVPRYKEFLDLIKKLSATDIEILEIAGQKQIQIKICYPLNLEKNIAHVCESIKDCKKEYDWMLPTQPNLKYSALTVNVNKLKEFLSIINQEEFRSVQLLYIHDY